MTNPIAQELREWARSKDPRPAYLSLDAWRATVGYRSRPHGEWLNRLNDADCRTFALLVAEALESEE